MELHKAVTADCLGCPFGGEHSEKMNFGRAGEIDQIIIFIILKPEMTMFRAESHTGQSGKAPGT